MLSVQHMVVAVVAYLVHYKVVEFSSHSEEDCLVIGL